MFLCDFSTLIYQLRIMHFRFFPVALLGLVLFSPQSFAVQPLSEVASAVPVASAKDKAVYIEAEQIQGKKDERMEAHGNVELQQGDQKVYSDHMFYEPDTGGLSAQGSVRVVQPGGTVSGPDLEMNLESNVGEMNKPSFSFKENSARGSAEMMHRRGELNYEFDKAVYTTCPAGNDDWLLKMSRLEIDKTSQTGIAHNAWVEFKGVPLLYTPWMDFPLDGRRRSGFLGPSYGVTASGGTEFTLPYYWNIAPNYDATIAVRKISKRGYLVNDEFRYMGESYQGEINYDILPSDHIANVRRTHSTLMHTQKVGDGGVVAINLNRVSDDAYFRDLSNTLVGGTQTQLLNEGSLSYGAGWWSASMKAQTYQTLQDPLAPVAVPYFRLPQIDVSAQKKIDDVQLNIVNEYVSFRHDNPSYVNGQRLVVYPSVTYDLLMDSGYYLKPKLGVHNTRFVMGYNNNANIPDTARTVPIFSLDGGMTFERDMKLGEGGYVQTLEPRMFYVKIPYVDQDVLPIYDTSLAGFSFAQMFMENRFYGNDRVGDANMATMALTSRLIDDEGGVERLRIALGERFSYQTPKVNMPGTTDTSSRSDILLSVGGQPTSALTLDGLLQYNPVSQQTQSYNASARYAPETGKVLNLGYRYTYVDGNPLHDVRQADISTQWPLFWRWHLVSRLSYSIHDQKVLEALGGLEYNQACWILRLVVQSFPTATKQVSTGIFVQLELNDLVAVGADPLSALRMSVPGYTKLNAH